MIDDQITQWKKFEGKYLVDVVMYLRYLARQRIPLQALDNNNRTKILYLLETKDDNVTKHFQGQVWHKYTHHDIQNGLLHMMASNVLRLKVLTICESNFFSIMADEGTDLFDIEQFLFCVRSVDGNLDVWKYFIGFYELEDIKSKTM